MAQIGDLFARLVSAGGTRGLSGDADRVLDAEPVFSFFNDRMRKHHTAEDFVADPALLWSTQTFLSRRGGLEAHLRAECGDGVAGFSDILVVVNPSDWRRSLRVLSEPWSAMAAHRLRSRFRTFCEEEDFHQLFPQRPVGVRVVEDGGLAMGGATIGLEKGEFVTGLLPNFYTGAQATSRPVVAFHLNIPGAWEGYREVGRLYSDQVLFTLGSHWLDNFHHPGLQLPALYRLQQFADGSFVHIINPEAMPDIRIEEQESNGATVLTLQHSSGAALAHLVLAIVDSESEHVEPGAGAWSGAASEAGENAWKERAPSPAHTLAPMVPATFQHGRTMVPAEVGARLFTLRERGVLLQRVHFSRFMTGYDVFIGPGGEVGTALEAPSATLQIRGRAVSVVAHVPDLLLDGAPLQPGSPLRLHGNRTLEVGGNTLELFDLSAIDLPHWPYLFELRRPGNSSHLVFGRSYRVGRDPRCSVRLPDDSHNGNIIWRPEVAAGGNIRSRNGEIPKSRFYIDSIMVASEHAELDLSDLPTLRGQARDCYSYVRRREQILPIIPRRKHAGNRALTLQRGDELLIGNCVFEVDWSLSSASTLPGPATPETLAAPPHDLPVGGLRPSTPSEEAVPAPAALPQPLQAPSTIDGFLDRAASAAEEPPRAQQPAPIIGPPMMVTIDPDAPPAPPRLVGPPMLPSEGAPAPVEVATSEASPTEPSQSGDPSPHGEAVEDTEGDTPPADAVLIAPPMLLDPTALAGPPEARPSDVPEPMSLLRAPPVPAAVEIPESAPTVMGSPAQPSPEAPDQPATEGVVVCVSEQDWQFELARPARFVTTGWMVAGTVTIGNHEDCDVVLPENQMEASQVFSPHTVARLKVRGNRGRMELLSPAHATLTEAARPVESSTQLDDIRLEVPRVDVDGEVDFHIHLTVEQSPALPDPRARLLRLNRDEPMAAALFTLGLPLGTPRQSRLGPITVQARWDGTVVHIADYLPTYRRPDGSFRPFFRKSVSGGFWTVPEDGRPFTLAPGDQLLCGTTCITLTADASSGD